MTISNIIRKNMFHATFVRISDYFFQERYGKVLVNGCEWIEPTPKDRPWQTQKMTNGVAERKIN